MKRVTKEHLQAVVDRINRITGSPAAQYVLTESGRTVGQIGNYHLDGAYGGYALHRMVSEGGGVEDVLQVGHVSKPELAGLMYAYIRGLEARQAAVDVLRDCVHAMQHAHDCEATDAKPCTCYVDGLSARAMAALGGAR